MIAVEELRICSRCFMAFGGGRKSCICGEPLVRSCNRHADCNEAERLRIERYPGTLVPANFHCHDDECEDCFGS